MKRGIFLWALLSLGVLLRAGPYSPAAGEPGSIAVAWDAPSITAWATGYTALSQGPGVEPSNPDTGDTYPATNVLGVSDAHDSTHNVLPLGDGGAITLTFAQPITNGPGYDFVVFENAVTDSFLELAYVAVSSDGSNFYTFPSVSLTSGPVGAFDPIDTTEVHNLAGKFLLGYGTPFDLNELAGQSGLDVGAVTHVRITDVVGNGSTTDSLDHPIYDPYPTVNTSGFDLDAVGVIHAVPEPGVLALLLLSLGGILASRRKTASVRGGFTLMEMLVVMAILGLLSTLVFRGAVHALDSGRATVSTSNLRQLALANLAYASDHGGSYAPAQTRDNLTRWHGSRVSMKAPFEADGGFLSPYLGESRQVGLCPLFEKLAKDPKSWEEGSGGYGYNAAYLGGTQANSFRPRNTTSVPDPTATVMFTTTAFAKKSGYQEYPFTEPYVWVDSQGKPSGRLQPSTHFRAGGKALVAWCDGHVTREKPNKATGPNYYGGNNELKGIGWFGPEDGNGFWNPDRLYEVAD